MDFSGVDIEGENDKLIEGTPYNSQEKSWVTTLLPNLENDSLLLGTIIRELAGKESGKSDLWSEDLCIEIDVVALLCLWLRRDWGSD